MNTRKLLRLAPTVIMVAVMGYSTYAVQPAAPAPLDAAAAKPKSAIPIVSLVLPDADEATDPAHLKPVRNPFLAIVQSAQHGHGKGGADAGQGAADPYRMLLQQMTLNATFVQGSVEYASINGRLYNRGEQLEGPDGARLGLLIVRVTPAEVVLEAEGKRYTLAYPEQFTASAGPARGPARTNRTTGRAGPQGRLPGRFPRSAALSPASR